MSIVDQSSDFFPRFPIASDLERHLTVASKQEFLEAFVPARDAAEKSYYVETDNACTSRERSRRFLGALINPLLGKPVDVQRFYETFGRLMRRAWLSISLGIYDEAIAALTDPGKRLHLAQVNTVDLAWRPALAGTPPDGLLVEVGTGRGNSIARLGLLLPRARIVSITISPEQANINRRIARNLGLSNVEIRLGDFLDPALSGDLIGEADAVVAIEVTGHFHHDRKAEGIERMARLLKPGGSLSLIDTGLRKPLNRFLEKFYSNQHWYFGSRDSYLSAFSRAGVAPACVIDYSADILQTFRDTSAVLRGWRRELQHDFGWMLSLFWPEMPGTVYLRTVKQVDYLHLVGIRNGKG